MGILEIHFHDSEFSWTVSTGDGEERSLSLGTGDRSGSAATDGGRGSALASKLRSVAVLALVVGGFVAVRRVRARRARQARERAEAESKRRSRLPILGR